MTVNNIEKPVSPKKFADCIREEFSKYNIQVQDVLLFGSRTTKNFRPDSDWDFLIITQKSVERTLKRKILSQIRRRLIFEYDIDSDLLVLPKDDISSATKDVGRVSYYAMRDGIPV